MATAFANVDTSALDRLTKRVLRIADPDATPLMITWMRIIDEDNRKGVLAGLDHNGIPMAAVTYRPKKDSDGRLTVEQRLGQSPRTKRGRYAAFGSTANAPYNNLTSSQYRKLTGPPLAPRRQFSRVITNLLTDYDDSERTKGRWQAWGYWDDVVSTKGISFLIFHFDGAGRLPKRDLRGLRPDGRDRAAKALAAWAADIVRSSR